MAIVCGGLQLSKCSVKTRGANVMQKCLIIDDADVIRKIASVILSDMGYQVSEAKDTDEALKLCQTESPNVIIVDWHIPHCDPLEFMKSVRSSFVGRRPYIIYCTTEKDPDAIEAALQAGADDFMLKPFDRNTLVNLFTKIKRAA